jgi:hypothetical protein
MTVEQDAAAVNALADWSPWVPFAGDLADVPRLPGVYMFRQPGTPGVVYVGMAGERAGSGVPQGLRGRLTVYKRGRGAVSGFGEAALDRALADPNWVAGQLEKLRADGPKRAKVWAQDAIEHLRAEVRWAVRDTAADARDLEARVIALLASHGLWNRPARAAADPTGDVEEAPEPAQVFTVRGHHIDLDVLYREMHRHAVTGPEGELVFAGNSPDVPAVKRLIHKLFGVPVATGIHPVNNEVRSEVRDRLRLLGWASKDPGRSGRYVLHRDL